MITRRTIDAVFENSRIDEVIGDFLSLKRRGSNLIALCPFHNEKTPSFMVSPSKNIYKCFGCGRAGGPVQFVMEHEKFTYPEAIRYLANIYGIEIEETETSDEEKAERQELESLHLVNDFALNTYIQNLSDTAEGRNIGLSYFKERGFLESTIDTFQLGYSLQDSESFKQKALEKGFSLERLQTLGLVSQKGFDFFRGRVIFPIHSVSGKVIGFGGRTLREGPREPKYLNSPESPVYNKRKSLYGLHLARHEIRKHDRCYLVEGYTDVISLYQSDIQNVVASSGTALTEDQVKLIKRFTPNITVLYDGDPAGIKAAMRGLDIMLKLDMNVRLVLLPEKNDPDSMVREMGSSAFTEYLESESKDFILFKTDLLSEESQNDPIARTRVTRDIIESIALIPDVVKSSHYIKECSTVLGIDESILIEEVNKGIRDNLKKESFRRPRDEVRRDFETIAGDKTDRKHKQEIKPKDLYSDDPQELAVVRLLVLYGHLEIDEATGITLAQYVLQELGDHIYSFNNPVCQSIIDYYCDRLEKEEVPTQEDLLKVEDTQLAEMVVSFLAPEFEYSPNWEEKKAMPLNTQKPPDENYMREMPDVLMRFSLKQVQKQIKKNKELILKHDQEGNPTEVETHLKVQHKLLAQKSELEAQLKNVGIRIMPK